MESAREVLREMWEKTTFGEYVRAMRECDEISQSELAAKLGVSRQYIHGVETNRNYASIKTAIKIADALGYSRILFIEKLLEGQLRRAGILDSVVIMSK
jgi:transcriptional regulator with XRE-family HTH domain